MTYMEKAVDMMVLRNPGIFHWRAGGEKHINDPNSIAHLQVPIEEILHIETVNLLFHLKSSLHSLFFAYLGSRRSKEQQRV